MECLGYLYFWANPLRCFFSHLPGSLDFNKGATPPLLPPLPLRLLLLLLACCTCCTRCHIASSGFCGVCLDPNTIPSAPDALGHAWARRHARESAKQNVRIDARQNARRECQRDCQIECQNRWQIECQKRMSEYRAESMKYVK